MTVLKLHQKITLSENKLTIQDEGLIYDRNKELIVYNEATYDLMITPKQATELDTTLICSLLKIDTANLMNRIKKLENIRCIKLVC